MAIKQGKIITITSVKGGTGKTITTLNLAGIFAGMNKKVLMIDMDFYSGSIAASLNLDGSQDLFNVVDDLSNNRFDFIENYVRHYDDNIDVLASPKDPRYASKITSKYLSIVINKAAMKYDVLLIDTNHMMDENKLVILDHSDMILYVITNDPMDIKNMKSMVSIYKDMNKSNYFIVLNEARYHGRSYFSKYDMKNIMKDNVDYTIPESFFIKNIDQYILDGKILTLDKKIMLKHKKAIKNYGLLAKALLKAKQEKK